MLCAFPFDNIPTLGRDGEPVRWVNETRIAPWTIHVLARGPG